MPGAQQEARCEDGISSLLVTKATAQDQSGKGSGSVFKWVWIDD